LRESTTAWAPGERFYYSNNGYKALGLVLSSLTGQPYGTTIRECVLCPLGMDNTVPTITSEIRTPLAVGYASWYDDR
jgi:CubicO group peptidase (beta-lactamase class C family)